MVYQIPLSPLVPNMQRSMDVRRWAGCLILVLAGCGGGAKDPFARVDVSGTVQLDGAPVAFGSISFTGQKNEATQEVAQSVLPIQGGKFSTASGGRGTSAGANDIVVTIFESDPAATTAENPDVKVIGSWKGQKDVQSGQPLSIELTTAELTK